MGGNLSRHIRDLRHLYLDCRGIRAAKRKYQEQRVHACRR